MMTPFLKWAGGKRQLLDDIERRMPEEYRNYYEPFIGGGALLFKLHPEDAVINDINRELIHVYCCLRDDADGLIDALSAIDRGQEVPYKDYYYAMRGRYNEKIRRGEYDHEMAALLIYLNKHCFNGLYRVNGEGLFNVPFNNTHRASFEEENLRACAGYLRGVRILNGDFEAACAQAAAGDFVFLDSPYAPLNPTSFESYTREGFDLESHKRLARLFEELDQRGCLCMLTNHDTALIRELYGNYHIDVVDVHRSINSDAANRRGTEVIVRNY